MADLATDTKPLADDNYNKILLSCIHFLQWSNRPITDHALSDLIAFKLANPNDTTLEQQLKIFSTVVSPRSNTNRSHRTYAATILGIFRRNFAPLQWHIHIVSRAQTIPIKEGVLLSIRNDSELSDEHRIAIDLMAYIGERYTAGNLTPLTDFHIVEGTNSVIIHLDASMTKNDVEHPSVIPLELYERIAHNAQINGYACALPNYRHRWTQITKLAQRKYGVRLTSHYFRKRFETRAEKIPANHMNPNHWMILMGCRPTHGHMPDIYSLMDNHELIAEYENYLAPRLALDSAANLQDNQSEIQRLQVTIAEQAEQIKNLTWLLSQLAAKR
jgi:hypothetical protein